MKYFAGIDQGGSKTDILIGDENGTLIDRYTGCGYSEFLKDIKDNQDFHTRYLDQQIRYLTELLNKNNLSLSDVYAISASVATVNSDDIKNYYEADLREKLSNPNVAVYNDMYGAWRAGTNKLPSGIMAIGTGTGIMFFDDNGNPTDLAGKIKRQAARELGFRAFLHACFSALGCLEPTILSENICRFAQTSTLEEALKNTKNGQDINALPYQHFIPYIYDAAIKKDRVAQDFINEVGTGLAVCVREGIKNLGWENKPIPLILNGGAFKGNGYIMETIIKESLNDLLNITIHQAEYEPVYGALMLSYDKYNNGLFPKTSEDDINRLNLKRILS